MSSESTPSLFLPFLFSFLSLRSEVHNDLKPKKDSELKPKDRRQKLYRARSKGQHYIFEGVPYYTVKDYKEHIPAADLKSATHRKGQKRVDQMIPELEERYPNPPYLILVNPVAGRGADIVVMKKESFTLLPYEPHHAFELTNEGERSYIPYKDMKRYVKSLKKFKCKRTLVVSYQSNLWNQKIKRSYRDALARNDISIEVKGEIPL
jgi:hypothetical protein